MAIADRGSRSLLAVVACSVALAACSDGADDADAAAADAGDTAAGECLPEWFASRAGNPLSCCQDGNYAWHTLDGVRLAGRALAAPCTEPDGVGTQCGEGTDPPVGCYFGPCGAHIDLLVDAEEVYVFHPTAGSQVCGWSVTNVQECLTGCDWAVGEDHSDPEPFVDQVEYPGVTSACDFSQCLVGGVPAL